MSNYKKIRASNMARAAVSAAQRRLLTPARQRLPDNAHGRALPVRPSRKADKLFSETHSNSPTANAPS